MYCGAVKRLTKMEEIRIVKRPRVNPTHRWSESETRKLAETAVDEIKGNPEYFEKPTAQRFYEKIAVKASLPNLTWTMMKSKMRHMKHSYFDAMKRKSQIRAENGDESSVQEYINRICPNFDLLHQLFSHAFRYDTTNDLNEFSDNAASMLDSLSNDEFSVSQQACNFIIKNEAADESKTPNALQAASALQAKSISPVASTSQAASFARAANTPQPASEIINISQDSNDSKIPLSFVDQQQKRKPSNKASSYLARLIELQTEKLQQDIDNFNRQKKKEKAELEVKRLKLMQEYELRKLELEIETEKLKLRIIENETEAYKRKKHKGLRPHPIYAKMKFLESVISTKSNETDVNNSASTSVIIPDSNSLSALSLASESNAEILTESNESDASDCFVPKVNDRILTLKKIRLPMQRNDNEQSVTMDPLRNAACETYDERSNPMDSMQNAYNKTNNERSVTMDLMQSAYKTLMENMQVDEHAVFANVIAQNLRTWSAENKPFALRYRAALSSLNAEFELEAAKNAVQNDVQNRAATIKLECAESDFMLT